MDVGLSRSSTKRQSNDSTSTSSGTGVSGSGSSSESQHRQRTRSNGGGGGGASMSHMSDPRILGTLLEQINLLHETNSKICRNLHDTKGKSPSFVDVLMCKSSFIEGFLVIYWEMVEVERMRNETTLILFPLLISF